MSLDHTCSTVKEIYEDINLCVKCGEGEVRGFVEKNRWVKQGSSLRLYLIFL